MKIRKKLISSTLISTVLATAAWLVAYTSVENIERRFEHILTLTTTEINHLKNIKAEVFRMEMEAISHATLLQEQRNAQSTGMGGPLLEAMDEENQEYDEAVKATWVSLEGYNRTFSQHLKVEPERASETDMRMPQFLKKELTSFKQNCDAAFTLNAKDLFDRKVIDLMEAIEVSEEAFLDKIEAAIANTELELAEDNDQARKAIANAMRMLVAISTLAFLLYVVTGWLLIRHISVPLEQLTNVTKLIRGGDTSHRAQVMAKDEIGELANSFNLMLDELAHARIVEHQKQELETLNHQLEKKNNALDSFVYRVSHDLKAPVVNISSLLGLLKKKINEEDRFSQQTMGFMEGSVKKLENTIHDLLEVSRIERQLALASEPTSLEAVLEEVKQNIGAQISESKAVVETDFSEVPTLLFAKANLQSIFSNLLTNAIKYHAPDRPPFIIVKSFRQADCIGLSIQDNGMGIDLERYGSKLFQMFTRLHNHVEGTGVGLYIVKKLVEESGGQIKVESKLDKGTCFTIFLPTKKTPTHAPPELRAAG